MTTPAAPRNASLDRFRTIAFDLAIMRQLIRYDPAIPSRIDASAWFAMVPECYRPTVARIVERVFDRNRGIKATDLELERITATIRDAIFREIEPIDPADVPPPREWTSEEVDAEPPAFEPIVVNERTVGIAQPPAEWGPGNPGAVGIRRAFLASQARPDLPQVLGRVEFTMQSVDGLRTARLNQIGSAPITLPATDDVMSGDLVVMDADGRVRPIPPAAAQVTAPQAVSEQQVAEFTFRDSGRAATSYEGFDTDLLFSLARRVGELEARCLDPATLLADLATAIPTMTPEHLERLYETFERLGTRMLELHAIVQSDIDRRSK